jgi:hypothetical protein
MKIVPFKIHVNMPLVKKNLVQKDEHFLHIQDLIDSKKQMLVDNQTKIAAISKQNKFLNVIKNDYVKYYNFIAQQKQNQILALDLLNEYIDNLTTSGELSKHNIEDAKFEQTKILREVKNIKIGLDEIINNTTFINNDFE